MMSHFVTTPASSVFKIPVEFHPTAFTLVLASVILPWTTAVTS